MLNQVYLGIGSNLNRENAILFAKAQLEKNFAEVKFSSVWESCAIRVAEPNYYNMVAKFETDLNLDDLYTLVTKIERQAGRELMYYNGTNFGFKRRLDIDILMFNQEVTTVPCKLPRHDIEDYPFVICPLLELDENIVHPVSGKLIKDIFAVMSPTLTEKNMATKIDFDFSKPYPAWTEVA